MEQEAIKMLEARLDAIIRLLAIPIVQGKPIAESAPVLSDLGLDNSLIAALCRTSPTVVRTAIRRRKGQGARSRVATGKRSRGD